MDDYNIVSLQESNNEWVSRLINLLSPCVIHGIREMLSESLRICIENDEEEKYLMTFQNILSRVPKWSNESLSQEVERIKEMSKCEYLEDLISCVHIVQLKALTCIRVGQKQKSIEIDIPKFDVFIHKVYIHLARKLFSNVYLFEANVSPLTIQKNNREVELIAKDCILEAVRESIPVETILRAYLDKTIEENVEQEIVHENVEVEVEKPESVSADVKEDVVPKEGGSSESVSVQESGEESESVSVLSQPVVSAPSISAPLVSSPVVNQPVTTLTNVASVSAPSVSAPSVSSPLVSAPAVSAPSLPPVPVVNIPTTSFSNPNTASLSEPNQTISFSNIDEFQNAETKSISTEEAPKDVVSLERRAEENYQKQLAMENEYDDDDDDDYNDRLKIHTGENIVLDVETL